MNDTHIPSQLSPEAAREIDQACDRFEAAWKAGRRPDPAEHLAAAGEVVRSDLLRELLVLDWDYRRRQGDSPRVDDYRARFPGDGIAIEAVGRDMAETPVSTQVGRDDGTGSGIPTPGPAALNGPSADSAGAQPATDAARYDLEREIGHGGIGIVFRGRDTVLGRNVAVKVLGEAYRDRSDARRRFIAEARIGSQLQHPAIVPVYELGRFDDGRPYITMKLVEGHTLATLLKQRTAPDDDVARFLNVFEQVCQAMAYAHSNGVVHRDLKPANVMVGAFGEVQVMDWGFAKVLGEDAVEDPSGPLGGPNGMSQSGSIMGTPAYMSPEQARGDAALIDPRADVFALGAMLCEILTGRPPYVGGTADAICNQASEGDLTEAVARLAACGADAALRDLAKRCLTADRADRPADAGVVARAVTAHLTSAQGRAVRAEIESAAANMRTKAERRARSLTGGLAAALLIGAAVAAWQAVVATRAKHDALSAAAAETAAKETADAKEAETREVLNFVEKKVIAAARPKGRFGGLGSGVTVRQALTAALPFVATSFADRPLIEARLRLAIGRWLFEVGDFPVAADQLAAARALYTKHRGPGDRDTLRAMSEYANCLGAMGRGAEAAKIHEEVLATRRAAFGSDDVETLYGMNNLAMSYFVLERYADAIRLHEEALPLKRAKFGLDDRSTLTTMVNLANCYSRLDRQHDSLKLREETIALQRARLGPKDYDTLMSLNNLAANYRKLDRYADALRADTEALAARTETLGPNHPDTLTSMWGEAEDLCNLGRGAEAVPILDDCLRRAVGQRVHQYFPTVADLRLRYFQKAKDAAGCRATAELWESLRRTDAQSLYEAAVCRAVTAGVIGQTSGTDATRLANEQSDLAMTWLKQAVAAGYKDADKLPQDADFAALRDRPDFRALTARK